MHISLPSPLGAEELVQPSSSSSSSLNVDLQVPMNSPASDMEYSSSSSSDVAGVRREEEHGHANVGPGARAAMSVNPGSTQRLSSSLMSPSFEAETGHITGTGTENITIARTSSSLDMSPHLKKSGGSSSWSDFKAVVNFKLCTVLWVTSKHWTAGYVALSKQDGVLRLYDSRETYETDPRGGSFHEIQLDKKHFMSPLNCKYYKNMPNAASSVGFYGFTLMGEHALLPLKLIKMSCFDEETAKLLMQAIAEVLRRKREGGL